MPDKNERVYLGDGVYVEYDGYHVVLTTSDGIGTTNRICLDSPTLWDFTKWIESQFNVKVVKVPKTE